MQCSPLQYINQKKVEKAKMMLILSNKSIKDVAYSLSFKTNQYFNQFFKNMTGMSPKEYKKNGH
jgi:YesN/AraC family two-component response regulator